MPIRPVLIALALALPVYATVQAADPSARATLKAPDGKDVGRATFRPAPDGVRVEVEAAGLPAGSHGIHVHATGRCDPPDFQSAGGHFNPAGKKHGLHSPDGAHAGDMPNLVVGPDGKASAKFTLRGATLGPGAGSLLDGAGTAIVVHAGPDDERTDPAGNSGARIACGIVERS